MTDKSKDKPSGVILAPVDEIHAESLSPKERFTLQIQANQTYLAWVRTNQYFLAGFGPCAGEAGAVGALDRPRFALQDFFEGAGGFRCHFAGRGNPIGCGDDHSPPTNNEDHSEWKAA